MIMHNKTQTFTNITVKVMFYLGIVATLSVPLWGPWFYKFVDMPSQFHTFMTIMLVFSGMCAVYILYNLKQIYSTLKSDPFIAENTRYLLNMGRACLVISVAYLLKVAILPTLATVIIILVFAMAWLFCLTLCGLFEKAVQYKQDNDMTI